MKGFILFIFTIGLFSIPFSYQQGHLLGSVMKQRPIDDQGPSQDRDRTRDRSRDRDRNQGDQGGRDKGDDKSLEKERETKVA